VPHPRVHHTIQRDHPVDNILGSIQRGVITRSRLASFCEHFSFVSPKEPKKVEEALDDEDWMIAMQEELNNFTRNEVWSLVERPKQNVIGSITGTTGSSFFHVVCLRLSTSPVVPVPLR
jgi:hypothetical protein